MIINNLALIINNFVLNLYSNGIKFYQIIIGLIIFDFIIWEITKLIKQAQDVKEVIR